MTKTKFTITLPKSEQERLNQLALSYGLSLPKLTTFVLVKLSNSIPSESFDDYRNPAKLKASFARAFNDYRAGRFRKS